MEVHEPVQSIGPALLPFQPLIQVAIRHDSNASLRCRLPDGHQKGTDLLGLAPSGDIGLKLREWSGRGGYAARSQHQLALGHAIPHSSGLASRML
jgi:hypothetical protein